jgi:hypothetical protein
MRHTNLFRIGFWRFEPVSDPHLLLNHVFEQTAIKQALGFTLLDAQIASGPLCSEVTDRKGNPRA